VQQLQAIRVWSVSPSIPKQTFTLDRIHPVQCVWLKIFNNGEPDANINPQGSGENNMVPEIIAEVSITYSCKVKASDRFRVTGSKDAMTALRSIWPSYEHVEFMYMMMLNRQNQVLGCHQISKGGMTGTVVDVRVVFQVALISCATSIILAHNHPSGNIDPSDADKKITRLLSDAGKILEIPVIDHIILTTGGHLSMADEGIL
jgi:DNA repair protein RadC